MKKQMVFLFEPLIIRAAMLQRPAETVSTP
jgi:hypothetical protein